MLIGPANTYTVTYGVYHNCVDTAGVIMVKRYSAAVAMLISVAAVLLLGGIADESSRRTWEPRARPKE